MQESLWLEKGYFVKDESMNNMHRSTERYVKKFVALDVLLLGVAVSIGISEKGALQMLAEERV